MSILLVHSQNTDKRSIACFKSFAEFMAFFCVATITIQGPLPMVITEGRGFFVLVKRLALNGWANPFDSLSACGKICLSINSATNPGGSLYVRYI